MKKRKRAAERDALGWIDATLGISRCYWRMRTQGKPTALLVWIPKTAGTSIHTLLGAQKLKSL